jgi:ribosome-associated protein
MKRNPVKMLNRIAQIIYDKKGFNILALNLKGHCSITDYLLIAEGNVDRHVISIARAIVEDFKETPLHIEGLANGDWIVIDFSDIVIHLFQPGLREKYSLEKLWKESKIVDLNIEVSAPLVRK